MPFALLIIGITLVVAAVRGTHRYLIGLIQHDFTGPGNFLYWVVILLLFGAIGYVEKLRPLSMALLALIMVSLFLSKRNGSPQALQLFTNFMNSLNSTSASGSPISINIPSPGPIGTQPPHGIGTPVSG